MEVRRSSGTREVFVPIGAKNPGNVGSVRIASNLVHTESSLHGQETNTQRTSGNLKHCLPSEWREVKRRSAQTRVRVLLTSSKFHDVCSRAR
jgi:hypothetical protein